MSFSGESTAPTGSNFDPRHIAMCVLSICIIIVIACHAWFEDGCWGWFNESVAEPFSTKTDKTTAVYNWWMKNKSNPEYINYKNDLNLESNIVEYEAARKLSLAGKLTKETIKEIV